MVLPDEISRHMGKRGEEQQAPNINLKGGGGAESSTAPHRTNPSECGKLNLARKQLTSWVWITRINLLMVFSNVFPPCKKPQVFKDTRKPEDSTHHANEDEGVE